MVGERCRGHIEMVRRKYSCDFSSRSCSHGNNREWVRQVQKSGVPAHGNGHLPGGSERLQVASCGTQIASRGKGRKTLHNSNRTQLLEVTTRKAVFLGSNKEEMACSSNDLDSFWCLLLWMVFFFLPKKLRTKDICFVSNHFAELLNHSNDLSNNVHF